MSGAESLTRLWLEISLCGMYQADVWKWIFQAHKAGTRGATEWAQLQVRIDLRRPVVQYPTLGGWD